MEFRESMDCPVDGRVACAEREADELPAHIDVVEECLCRSGDQRAPVLVEGRADRVLCRQHRCIPLKIVEL
ncbi:hypothetical protein AB0B94_06525 [Micromonospora sp. NPDC048986]|uniref:hypothetical protein n=1 Tax=Micromonospora sp. NPDC048986 TaxID=3155644 RepID=UPI0033E7BEA2